MAFIEITLSDIDGHGTAMRSFVNLNHIVRVGCGVIETTAGTLRVMESYNEVRSKIRVALNG